MNRQSSKNNRRVRWRWLLRWKNALNHDYENFHIYARPCMIPYLFIFYNMLVHFVKFSKSFTTEVIKSIIGMLSYFISWDDWLYMGPGRVRF